MAWGNQGRSHYEFGAGNWSQYYWSNSNNPGATFDLCMANCTTYAYGRVMENGLPRPVTQFRNANNWHNYVNTSDGWSLLTYSSGMALVPGDIVEWSGNHVAVVETSGTNPYISGSFYTGDDGTGSSNRSTAVMGNSLYTVSLWMNATSSRQYRFYHYVTLTTENSWIGNTQPSYVLRYTGGGGGGETPQITISPSSYTSVMSSADNYIDFQFNITVTGIPSGYSASGNNTYPGLSRVQNTGWSYTDYTVNGVTYRRATKTQTLRYTREYSYAYTTTKYMYYSFSYPNGSASSTTPMRITVQAQDEDMEYLYPFLIKNRNKRKHVRIKLKQRP